MSELRLRADRLQWLDAEGEIVALDEAALVYLAANGSGALLWKELARGTTRQALVARLAEAFSLDPEVAAVDTDRFLADLEQRGLLER